MGLFNRKKKALRSQADAARRTRYSHMPYDNGYDSNAIVTGMVVASSFSDDDSNDAEHPEPVSEPTYDTPSYDPGPSDSGSYDTSGSSDSGSVDTGSY